MPRIRVLIVDDSVMFRRLITEALSGDPDIEVVGTASNGRLALARMPQYCPDLVTLDLEMPEMGGLAALEEMRSAYPRTPVIVFSGHTRRGAKATFDALALGATDCATKPVNAASTADGVRQIRETLIQKVKALCAARLPTPAPAPAPPRADIALPWSARPRVEVVVIGVSTGGPNALLDMLPRLPADLEAPVLIVQHMPPLFTQFIAERLRPHCALAVGEAASGQPLLPGHIWLAPGDHHLALVRDGDTIRLHTNQGPPENSCRPAADVLFRAAAEVFGAGTLAVVMTGMGQDGLRGSRLVHEVGGRVLAQDEATSVVWGMPGAVVRAGLAERIVPLPLMADTIIQAVRPPALVLDRQARPR